MILTTLFLLLGTDVAGAGLDFKRCGPKGFGRARRGG